MRERLQVGFKRSKRGRKLPNFARHVVVRGLRIEREARDRTWLREQHYLRAADAEKLSANRFGFVGSKKRNEASHERGVDSERLLFIRLLRVVLRLDRLGYARRTERCDGIDGDAAARHVVRDDAREAEERSFAARIRRLSEITVEARGRDDVHDAAPTIALAAAAGFSLLAHERSRRANRLERGGQIVFEDVFEVFELGFESKRVADDRGIVDEDVDSAERARGQLDGMP